MSARPPVSAAGTATGGELEYVGFWPRVAAQVVDSLWLTPIILVLGWKLVQAGPDLSEQLLRDPASISVTALMSEMAPSPLDFVIQYLVPAVLILLFWMLKNATPGKMLLHAKIVDATTGEAPTRGQLVIRYLGYYVSILTFFLGFLWIAVDPRKQGFHDKLANTVVVRPKPVVSFPGRNPR